MKKILINLCCVILMVAISTKAFTADKKHKLEKKAEVTTPAPEATPLSSETVSPAEVSPKEDGFHKVETTWKKGLQFKSKDEKYSLKFRIRIQPRYTFETRNAQGEDNESTFEIRRAKFSWEGNAFTKNLDYKVQINVAVTDADKILEDAYLDYRFFDPLRIEFGQFKIPYNFQEIISSGRLQFVDRSLASGEFRFATTNATTITTCTLPDGSTISGSGITCGGGATSTTTTTFKPEKFTRDIGLMLHGDAWNKKFEYYLGVTNGSGPNQINANNDFLYTGRLVWNPLGHYGLSESDTEYSEHPALTFAADAGYHVEDGTNEKETLASADIGFKYKGASFQGEGYFRNNRPVAAADTNDFGYYAQAGYFVIPKYFEIAARASQIFLAGPNNNKGEFTGVLNYFIFGHDLKVQADYSFLPSQVDPANFAGATSQNDHRFRLQLQAWF